MSNQFPKKPRVLFMSAVAKNILVIQIEEGWVEGGVQVPYRPEPGETLCPDAHTPHLTWIEKDGRRIGTLVKDSIKGDQRFVLETRCGEDLDTQRADDPASYRINGVAPVRVWRKSKPSNVVDPSFEVTMEHMVYLVLPSPLREGEAYELACAPGLLDADTYTYVCDPANQRSEAVHVSQIGFRPGDPSKKPISPSGWAWAGALPIKAIKLSTCWRRMEARWFTAARSACSTTVCQWCSTTRPAAPA